MKKCIIVPDSFKGSLDSIEICRMAAQSVERFFPGCEVVTLPVADGGEGTVDCFLQAMEGKKVSLEVQGPFGEPVQACYARMGETAVVEMAQAAGLPMVEGRANPALTTTFGVGQLIRHAVQAGARQIILGLGGSATNDGGCGCAAALGTRFLDENGQTFVPVGGTLEKIKSIDLTETKTLLEGCTVTVMCDVENPMYGETGAAYIYGPQKGADPAMVQELDRQLRCLNRAMTESLGIQSVAQEKGAGAAGAFGAGAMVFLGARLQPGIQAVLDIVSFEKHLEGADAVFTGEGKIDGQSLRGKVVIGVSRRAQAMGVPVYAVVGDVGDDAAGAYEMGVTAIFSINRVAVPFEIARTRSRKDYQSTFEDILRLIRSVK